MPHNGGDIRKRKQQKAKQASNQLCQLFISFGCYTQLEVCRNIFVTFFEDSGSIQVSLCSVCATKGKNTCLCLVNAVRASPQIQNKECHPEVISDDETEPLLNSNAKFNALCTNHT